MRAVAILPVVLLTTALASVGCNAILDIGEHTLAPSRSDAAGGDADTGIDAETGPPRWVDAADGTSAGDAKASPDRRETDITDDGNSGSDAADAGKPANDAADAANDGGHASDAGNTGRDAADAGNTGRDASDAGNTGRDASDADSRILLRGTISTLNLSPAPAGTIRLVDHGIAVPWKSCNASNCISGGIAP
jgi:hypothetical protein